MTEMEFGERLRKYRKENNMTQQELAEKLGVSDKSVSRWENGSYPDAAMLGTLAKLLGVTVDDLLGEEPPVRSLERTDWQNIMSFAFAIGSGIIFYLLDLFVPTLLCYGVYLGMMAYGVYLQKNYTFHSKWFHTANLAMNFFVNLRMIALITGALPFMNLPSDPVLFSYHYLRLRFGESYGTMFSMSSLGSYLFLFTAGLLVTGWTTYLIGQYFRSEQGLHPQLSFKHFSWKKALPILCPMILTGFWALFYPAPAIVPVWFYVYQNQLFYGLLAVLALLTFLWLIGNSQKGMLYPAGLMLLFCTQFPNLCAYQRAFSIKSGKIYAENIQALDGNVYHLFNEISGMLVVTAAVLIILYVLCCLLSLRPSVTSADGHSSGSGM